MGVEFEGVCLTTFHHRVPYPHLLTTLAFNNRTPPAQPPVSCVTAHTSLYRKSITLLLHRSYGSTSSWMARLHSPWVWSRWTQRF